MPPIQVVTKSFIVSNSTELKIKILNHIRDFENAHKVKLRSLCMIENSFLENSQTSRFGFNFVFTDEETPLPHTSADEDDILWNRVSAVPFVSAGTEELDAKIAKFLTEQEEKYGLRLKSHTLIGLRKCSGSDCFEFLFVFG